jgi:threonine aldolase
VSDPDWRETMRACTRGLFNQRPRSASQWLRDAADALAPELGPDVYGEGAIVQELEARVAGLLGAEAALLMPSGTMAQQIALRIHCDRRGTRTVAFHPTCHLELHEHAGYAHLHGLVAELVGDRDRLIELADLESLHVPLGALLIELPQREIGGRLPDWDDLIAQVGWARERGAAVHLDGARLWEASPYYRRAPAEIAALFDSVYVSLYKGLGALAGSVLAGSRELVDEARVWRRRHGGALYALFPFAASAARGLDELVGRMGEFLAHAQALAGALGDVPEISVVPMPPQTPLFHLHLRGEREALWERMLEVARDERVWLGHRPAPTVLAGVSRIELHLGEPALEITAAEAAKLFARVVASG